VRAATLSKKKKKKKKDNMRAANLRVMDHQGLVEVNFIMSYPLSK
jgi:hypothetical protein